jgi:ribulose-5-phosphate 4-epimerase/fuculose-1-phosphate aldolase
MSQEENHITKFETEFESKEVVADFRIEDLKNYSKLFSDYNLAPPYPGGSHGNLSYRCNAQEDPFIITASMTALFNPLKPEDFTKVNFVDIEANKVYAEGSRLPSSESIIHFGIYRIRHDVNAIFHAHSPDILAKAEELGIAVTAEEQEFGTLELVDEVLEVAEIENFLIMKNHGFISMGANMEEAWQNVEYFINKLELKKNED